MILIEVAQLHPLLQLLPAVRLESRHRPGRKIDLSPAAFALRLSHDLPAALSHEGTPHSQCTPVQVGIVPAEPQELSPPETRGYSKHVESLEPIPYLPCGIQ